MERRIALIVLGIAWVCSIVGCYDLFAIPLAQVSSTGEYIAFLTGDETTSRLNILNLATEELRQVGDSGMVLAFAMGPDQELAYAEPMTSGTAIYQVNLPTGETSLLTTIEDAIVRQMAFSPSGDQIAFDLISASVLAASSDVSYGAALAAASTTSAPAGSLMILDLPTHETTLVSIGFTFFGLNPRWSPDARYIALTALADASETQDMEIFVYDTQTQTAAPLIFDPAWANSHTVSSPNWLDESTLLLAYSPFQPGSTGDQATAAPPQESGLAAYDLTTGVSSYLYQTTAVQGILSAVVSPDRERVALISTSTGSVDASILDLTNNQVTSFIAGMEFFDLPLWSPDGDVLYLSNGLQPMMELLSSSTPTPNASPSGQITRYDLNHEQAPTVIYTGEIIHSPLITGFVSEAMRQASTAASQVELSEEGQEIANEMIGQILGQMLEEAIIEELSD